MKYFLLSCLLIGVGCTQITDEPVLVEDRVIVWGEVQAYAAQAPEQWNWAAADAVFAQSDQPISIAIWPYALWDQATCHASWPSVVTVYGLHFQAPYPPCDQAAYQLWVKAVVKRYDDRVSNWRILDDFKQQEPPFANFIGSTEDYQAVVELTKTAIMPLWNVKE